MDLACAQHATYSEIDLRAFHHGVRDGVCQLTGDAEITNFKYNRILFH